jgi:hypothetical protein
MSSIFRYCIHRVIDGQEVVVPIPEVEPFLVKSAIALWRATPIRRRFTDQAITDAMQGAFDEAHVALQRASLRI